MAEQTADEAADVEPPHIAVPALPVGRIDDAVEAARVGALVAEVLGQLSQRSASAGLPSPDDCGLSMDFETMASVGFVLAAWAEGLLEAAERAGYSPPPVAEDTRPGPSGLHRPPGLLLPPGVRSPESP
jgi:hypothetical protein